jgi:PhoPQ-activated pathogenicity-related protein
MDIVDEIGWRLGVLASRAAQERYMVNATRDEYLLIEEAVNDALAIGEQRLLQAMDHRTRDPVSRFLVVLRAEMNNLDSLPRMPWPETALENRSVAVIRSAARACLAEIGFDLAEWERSEGYAA